MGTRKIVHPTAEVCFYACCRGLSHSNIILGAEINKIKKNYQESQGRRNNQLIGLGNELHGVQKVMYDNIDAVLQRGELISGEKQPPPTT